MKTFAQEYSGWGSSPLTRGALAFLFPGEDGGGLIPAYAGSTEAREVPPDGPGAHPRLRGKHVTVPADIGRVKGSSPLTRGALFDAYTNVTKGGLIPAYAGSTMVWDGAKAVFTAHPRLRGEHDTEHFPLAPLWGSSPLTRGAPLKIVHDSSPMGLIPAYAGSTTRCPWLYRQSRAHPRLRGEHNLLIKCSIVGLGSSPLTRGALPHVAGDNTASGLIPAYAGSTH